MQARLQPHEFATYAERLQRDPSTWIDLAQRYLHWERVPTQSQSGTFTTGDLQWFSDGQLDPTVSCLDRHLSARSDDTALIAIGDEDDKMTRWSFRELYVQVCKAANVLAEIGVKPGDAVGICLPNIPEAAVAMLACARLGAIHGVVFAGFGAEALAQRWQDLGCRVVITADVIKRGGRTIPLKATVDEALKQCLLVTVSLVVCRCDSVPWQATRDRRWDSVLETALPDRAPFPRPGHAPLFVLHTSGSTGRPKGLVQSTAGFLLHAAMTMQATTGYQDGDRYACLADLGWITGHAYVLYGPLINGAPVFLDEGTPLFPGPQRYWRIVERFDLHLLFTVPTALRLIAAQDPLSMHGIHLCSLRSITCAGEVLDEATCRWIGQQLPEVSLVNIYGQTEASGHLLAGRIDGGNAAINCPGLRPVLGINPALMDDHGAMIHGPGKGHLVINDPWPGLAITIHGDHERFQQSYLLSPDGVYATKDMAERDHHGVYTIIGRSDEVVSIAGHRLAPAEVESIARSILGVSDAIAAAVPDPIRGSVLVLFIVSDRLAPTHIIQDVRQTIREQLGAFACPRAVVVVPGLPRTRSGKPMRRLLMACVLGKDMGDTSTLADATVIDGLRTAWNNHISTEFKILPTLSPGT